MLWKDEASDNVGMIFVCKVFPLRSGLQNQGFRPWLHIPDTAPNTHHTRLQTRDSWHLTKPAREPRCLHEACPQSFVSLFLPQACGQGSRGKKRAEEGKKERRLQKKKYPAEALLSGDKIDLPPRHYGLCQKDAFCMIS
jgi:hypothetical protein